MEIIVTKHAVDRYIERTFDDSQNLDKIKRNLELAARYGKIIAERKDGWIVAHRDVEIIVVPQGNAKVVVTCLGSQRYQKWSKVQHRRTRAA